MPWKMSRSHPCVPDSGTPCRNDGLYTTCDYEGYLRGITLLASSAFLEFIYILAVLNLASKRYRSSYLRKQVSRTYAGFLDASFRWHDVVLLPGNGLLVNLDFCAF